MSYLIYVAVFGAATVYFLWLRDARIFYRTGLPGYRHAAYYGILYGALALLGVAFTWYALELLGLGIVLAALYLQGRETRERVWTSEETLERVLGSVRMTAQKKG